MAEHPLVHAKEWYLNPTGFMIRFVAYFVIFIFIAGYLRNSSRKQDVNLDPNLGVKRNTTGPVGLVVFFVTMTFAITDWIMSIEPGFSSSMLPLLSSVGAGLSALSLGVIILLVNRNREPYKTIVTPQLTKDLGNMLFAFTLLWQYLTLSQYLIIYSGNLVEEVPYYLRRNENGWTALIAFIIIFQFFVPFTALLAPRTKRYAKNLLVVAIVIFFTRFLDVYWTIIPGLRHPTVDAGQTLIDSITQNWWRDLLGLALGGGLWMSAFGSQIGKVAILPKHDTRLLEVEHAH